MSDMDQDYFDGISDVDFADEIRKYPCIWDTSKKDYRKTKTMKSNAWPEIATLFKTSSDLAQTRYKSLRTKLSRYLKSVKPSGSGTADFVVRPDYEPFKWLFSLIKARPSTSNITTAKRPSSSASSSTAPSTSTAADDIVDGDNPPTPADDSSVTTESSTTTAEPATTTTTAANQTPSIRTTAPAVIPSKRRRRPATDDLESSRAIDNAILAHLRSEAERSEEDQYDMFCKSLAPQLRRLTPDQYLKTQMRILQSISEATAPPFSSPAMSSQPPQAICSPPPPPQGNWWPGHQQTSNQQPSTSAWVQNNDYVHNYTNLL